MLVDTKTVIYDYPKLDPDTGDPIRDDNGDPVCEPVPFAQVPILDPETQEPVRDAAGNVLMRMTRPMTFRDVVRMALNSRIDVTDNPPPEEKDRSYDIFNRVSLENPCDLDLEIDIPHILRYVGRYLGPLPRGRMTEILSDRKALPAAESTPPPADPPTG